jgi:hypothetical protein
VIANFGRSLRSKFTGTREGLNTNLTIYSNRNFSALDERLQNPLLRARIVTFYFVDNEVRRNTYGR